MKLRLSEQGQAAIEDALALRYSAMIGAGDVAPAILLFRAAGEIGMRDAIPYSQLPELPTIGSGAPWQVTDDGVVVLEDGTGIGLVWTVELTAGHFNFSCRHHRCPQNLTTYPRRIEAAAAAEDHWRNCPANHHA